MVSGRDTKNDGKSSWLFFNNTKVWLCNSGVNDWGQRLDLEYYEAHDTIRGAQLFSSDSILHGIIDADTPNPNHPLEETWQRQYGMLFYDTFVQGTTLLHQFSPWVLWYSPSFAFSDHVGHYLPQLQRSSRLCPLLHDAL